MKNRDEIFEQLEIIQKEHGIEVIREYMKKYNKQARKKQPRVNKQNDAAADVYFSMFGMDKLKTESEKFLNSSLKMDVTRALDYVGNKRNIRPETVKEHKRKFDKFAKEMNYQKFGYHLQEFYERHSEDYGYSYDKKLLTDFIKYDFQDINHFTYSTLDMKILIAFYLKYKNDVLNNNNEYFPF